ncbi:hypothetical protein EV127DRAFT_411938 [Xylaria flabelliformis]|nr:hypothetical protein EV127DRAFT_411938 [Xylaria flabelliformis]
MAEFYIPPKEISFRLKNKSTNEVLFSREKNPSFGQFEGDTFADQWWHLVPGTGEYEGRYLVKSNFTDKVLFSRTHKKPHVDHIDGDGKWADQWFKLEPDTGDRENWFRIRNTSSDTVVHSGDGVDNIGADDEKNDDQYWCFEFEDMKFVGIDYKIDEHKILSNTPEAIGSDSITNEDTDTDQSNNIIITQTKTVTSIHEQTHGVTIKASFTWRLGVPVVADTNNITLEVSQNNEWKTGEHISDTKTFTVTVPVIAKPGTKITATVTATKSELEVPYVMTWKSAKTGYQFKTKGVYKGTSYWNVETVVKKDKLYNTDENRDLGPEDQEEEKVEAEVRVESMRQAAEGEERGFDDENLQDGDGAYDERTTQDNGYDQAENYGEEDEHAQDEQSFDREQSAPEEIGEHGEEYGGQGDDEEEGGYAQNINDEEEEQEEQEDRGNEWVQEPTKDEEFTENENYTQNNGYEPDGEYEQDGATRYEEELSYEDQPAQGYKRAQQYDAVEDEAL